MSLDINKYENMLTVSYSPYNTTVDFIFYGIEENKTFCLKNVFYIYKEIHIAGRTARSLSTRRPYSPTPPTSMT